MDNSPENELSQLVTAGQIEIPPELERVFSYCDENWAKCAPFEGAQSKEEAEGINAQTATNTTFFAIFHNLHRKWTGQILWKYLREDFEFWTVHTWSLVHREMVREFERMLTEAGINLVTNRGWHTHRIIYLTVNAEEYPGDSGIIQDNASTAGVAEQIHRETFKAEKLQELSSTTLPFQPITPLPLNSSFISELDFQSGDLNHTAARQRKKSTNPQDESRPESGSDQQSSLIPFTPTYTPPYYTDLFRAPYTDFPSCPVFSSTPSYYLACTFVGENAFASSEGNVPPLNPPGGGSSGSGSDPTDPNDPDSYGNSSWSPSEEFGNRRYQSQIPQPVFSPVNKVSIDVLDRMDIITDSYIGEEKYTGRAYCFLRTMTNGFLDRCNRVGLEPEHYARALPIMLSGPAQMFYVSTLANRNLSYRDLVEGLRSRFEPAITIDRYWDEWQRLSLNSFMADHPDKTTLGCFNLLVERIQLLHGGIFSKREKDTPLSDIQRALRYAVRDNRACVTALLQPPAKFEDLVASLRQSIVVFETTHSRYRPMKTRERG